MGWTGLKQVCLVPETPRLFLRECWFQLSCSLLRFMLIFEGEDYEIQVMLFWDGCAGDRLVLVCLHEKLFITFLSLLAENAQGKVAIANDSGISDVASFWFVRSPWERSTWRSSLIPPFLSSRSRSHPLSRLWFPLSLLALPLCALLHETPAGDNDALYPLLFQVVSLIFYGMFPEAQGFAAPALWLRLQVR